MKNSRLNNTLSTPLAGFVKPYLISGFISTTVIKKLIYNTVSNPRPQYLYKISKNVKSLL